MIGIFLDTEANGLNFEVHYPIEIAIQLINLENGEMIESYSSMISLSSEQFDLSDPTSLAYTGATYEEIQKGKSFAVVKSEILSLFKRFNLVRERAFFICQNPSFDRLFFSKIIDSKTQEELRFPYNWLDLASMYWSRSIRERKPISLIRLSKDAIAEEYSIAPEKKPHRAQNGVAHLVDCYKKVVGFVLT